MTDTAQPVGLTPENVRAGMIRLPESVRTRAQAAEFLALPTRETEDVNLPYCLMAITNTQVDGYPFALVLRVPRDNLRKQGWPVTFCPETRIMAVRKRTGKVTPVNSIY